ncbi:MAG TPA: hypothetical protein VNL91_01405, partial [Thermoanaerobaculia bacterium]|nr:hypothetical protein [Thermoanaerobaculia bacterium]
MPAILYFATAAAILRIVHGTTTTLSRRAAIVLLLLPLLLTGRALVTGGVYGPIDLAYDEEPLASLARDHGITSVGNPMLTDVQRLMIPWRAAVRYAFAHGEWPLWNPFTFSGDILAAASEPSPWHPFHLLGQLLPLAQSITFEATLVFFAAALAAFLFARDLGASEDASFVAAAGWMLSQFILFFGQVPLGAAVLMQPLVFVSVRRIAERPDWRSIARLAIVLALVVVAGHPESTLHVVTLGIAWGVFEMVRLRSWSRAARVAGAATLAGILALLLSSIHLLPFLEALPQTADYELRVTKFANERRWVDALEAAVRLLRAIVPFVFGSPATETAAVPARYYDPAFPYAGSIVIAAAAAGWLGWRDRARWFLAGLAVFGFLAGVSAPGISHLLARLPLFEIALNERFIFSAVLAVVTLAAFGVDRMASGRWSAVPLAVTVAIAGTVAALWPWMLSRGLTTTHLHQNAVREIVPLALASAVFLIG